MANRIFESEIETRLANAGFGVSYPLESFIFRLNLVSEPYDLRLLIELVILPSPDFASLLIRGPYIFGVSEIHGPTTAGQELLR